MTRKTTRALIFGAVIFSLFGGGVALADHDHKGRGRDHGKKNHKERSYYVERHDRDNRYDRHGRHASKVPVVVHVHFDDRSRRAIHDYYRHCPPGLKKKKNGCVPPGHAMKRYDKPRYVIGRPLPPTVVYAPLPPYLVGHLPPPQRGYTYGYVDGDVLLIAEATHRVVDAVVAVNAAMNGMR